MANPILVEVIQPQSLLSGQLNQAPWSQFDLLTETPQDPLWQAWNKGQTPNNTQILIEDANVRAQAAVDGQGLILADLLMQAELDTGVLVRISNHHLKGVDYGIKANSQAGAAVGGVVANARKHLTSTLQFS